MEWACTECGRTYHEPPESCAICGNDTLVPGEDGRDSRGSTGILDGFISRAKGVLFDPDTVDRGLLSDSQTVTAIFRVLAVVSGLLVLLAVLALLL